ncbi:MAG TPA: helix-turn-helix domain-containing protein [Solirubrobacterales bacterium]|nr:helix-turn-helix domain-containing protein [Solirubrobacterales bacterium]
MTNTLDSDPWRGLPTSVADMLEPGLPAIAEDILTTIGREVPEYARPLEGRFGRGLRRGVEEALRQFLALIRDPDAGREHGRGVYVELGRGEQRVGRNLDSLQAAYRLGARVAWRRFAEVGSEAGLEPEALTVLADAIFAYIDELSADSVEGYAEAQAAVDDLRRRRRQELAVLLLREPAADPEDLAAAAQAAGWRVPARVAAAACADGDLGPVAGRLPPEALVTLVDGVGCLLLPDPEGPGRLEELTRAAGAATVALGPTTEAPGVGGSWRLASALLRAVGSGFTAGGGLRRAEDHLTELLLFENRRLVARIAARRLAPLEGLTPRGRQRMAETALAHVRHHGNAVAMAAELHVHPQTARYRIARLRELFGDDLDDPDARFELELALRSGGAGLPAGGAH